MLSKSCLIAAALLMLASAACNDPKNISGNPSALTVDTLIPPSSGRGSEQLYASRWIPVELDGLTLMPTSTGQQAYLLFSPGQVNTVAGSTGCNRLNGTFELSGVNKIKFSPISTTKMMCEPDGNNTEKRLLTVLPQANNYYFRDNQLILLNGKIVVAKFIAQQSNAESMGK